MERKQIAHRAIARCNSCFDLRPFHAIAGAKKLAEICGEYLTKGKQIYIEGSIRSRQWDDPSGNKRTAYDIVARTMQMLGSKADSERAASASAHTSGAGSEELSAPPEPAHEGEITDDDIPF